MNNMFFHKDTFEVPIGSTCYYYWDNKFKNKYSPWFYSIFWWGSDKGRGIILPIEKQFIDITNQEVITNDNISLRLSVLVEYKINDGKKFINSFSPQENEYQWYLWKSYDEIRNTVQIYLREFIFWFESIKLSESQNELRDIDIKNLNKTFSNQGIEIVKLSIKDINFPRKIQELFAKKLEANIRSHTDLENARTAVATARALKNASKMISEDESTKFLYYLETVSKIASKWNHTFNISEMWKK